MSSWSDVVLELLRNPKPQIILLLFFVLVYAAPLSLFAYIGYEQINALKVLAAKIDKLTPTSVALLKKGF